MTSQQVFLVSLTNRGEDAAAMLRGLKALEECGQMESLEAAEWRRRIVGWVRFNAVAAAARPNA